METLSCKGYTGSLRYSKEDKIFWGKIEMIRSLVAFEADNAAEPEKAFQEAVDDYLATCKGQAMGQKGVNQSSGIFLDSLKYGKIWQISECEK